MSAKIAKASQGAAYRCGAPPAVMPVAAEMLVVIVAVIE
jgi:hypothetical protein